MQGRQITFRDAEQKQSIRLESLGEGYSEAELRAVIAGEKVHVPWKGRAANRPRNQLLIDIAASYGCTVAQLCIRWCLQRRAIPLPKSTDAGRISENARVFWFNITDEDLQRIDELAPLGQSGLDPDTIDF